MKGSASPYRPIVFFLSAVMLAVCSATAVFDHRFAPGILLVTLIAIPVVFFSLRKLEKDQTKYWTQVAQTIGAQQSDSLAGLSIPVLAADNTGTVVWYNDCAASTLFADDYFVGRPLSEFMPAALQGVTERSVELSYNNRVYDVYSVAGSGAQEHMQLYYLIDYTRIKSFSKEYFETRPSVMVISIDSYEENLLGAKENERTQMLVQIETLIEKSVGEAGGILCKTNRDRYIAIVEERWMRKMVESRFPLLDQVRELPNGDRPPLTLSIGAARNVPAFNEGLKLANAALDMALSRGGDQLALREKNDGDYGFFGGVTKAFEKRSKVKTRYIARAIRQQIIESSDVILMGHKNADLDCFGACVAFYGIVSQLRRPVSIALGQNRQLVEPMLAYLADNGAERSIVSPEALLERVSPKTLLIIFDTHRPAMLESEPLYRACRNVIYIDHHRRMSDCIGNAVLSYHEAYPSSAAEMVTELVQYMGEPCRLGRVEADALLAGIMLDTKNFVLKAGIRTFEAAAYLSRMKADQTAVRRLFASTLEDYQQRTRIVSAAKVYNGCAIAQASGGREELRLIVPQAADDLLGIADVDASIVFYELDGVVSFSARSMGAVNVQLICEKLGGGGHQDMAGAQLSGVTAQEAYERLIAAIDAYKAENSQIRP